MSVEQKFLRLAEEPEMQVVRRRLMARRNGSHQEDSNSIDNFLGEGEKVEASVIEPRYYGELLAWALKRYIELEGWRVTRTLGYLYPEPVYIAVNTSHGEYQDALRNGLLLVEKGESRFVITVDVNLRSYNIVVVNGLASREKEVDEIANGIRAIVTEQNFYRGKNLELGRQIRFLKPPARNWDSIVLDVGIKDEIWGNTIGFLTNREHLANYGIPSKGGTSDRGAGNR